MNKLSKTDEQRILTALDDVRDLLSRGQSPNDAVTKVAADYKLRPSFIQLMVNAVNTGRTNQQRMDAGEDAIKAAEDFEIADPEVILERLFPATVKKSAELVHDTVVSPIYASQASAERLWKEKAAAAKTANTTVDWTKLNGDLIRKPVPYPTDPLYLMKKAAGIAERCKQRAENARRDTQVLHDKVAGLVGTLVEYFRQPGALPFKEVQANAEPLLGHSAKFLIDIVGQRVPRSYKTAEARHNKPIDYDKPPYSTLRQCVLLAAEYQHKKAEYGKIIKEAAAETDKALLPFAPRPVLRGSVLDGGTSFIEKLAVGAWAMPAMQAWDMVRRSTPMPQSKTDAEVLEGLTDPGHEAELRNLRAQATLTKLMSGPFSRYDPSEVMEAYNRVSPFVTEGAEHEALLQDSIQKQLAGGPGALDIFTIKELSDINKRLRESREPMYAGPKKREAE